MVDLNRNYYYIYFSYSDILFELFTICYVKNNKYLIIRELIQSDGKSYRNFETLPKRKLNNLKKRFFANKLMDVLYG